MLTTVQTTILPTPSKTHATCAWCGETCASIVDLIDHVDGHLPDGTAA